MKKLFRNMMAICIAIVAMSSLTSCLKEDNEDFTITAEERSKIFNACRGIHDGTLYPLCNTYEGVYKVSNDSVNDTSFMIMPDSTIQVNEVPDSIFANIFNSNITDQYKIAQAIKQSKQVQSISAKTCYIGYTDSNKSTYFCSSYPANHNIGIEIEGKSHTLNINCYISVYYSPAKNSCQATITPQSITIDSTPAFSPNGVYLGIIKRKK